MHASSSSRLLVLLTSALLLAACTGAQTRQETPIGPPAFGPDLRPGVPATPVDAPWRAWLLDGDAARAQELLSVSADTDDLLPESRLLRAELLFHQGHFTRAYADHLLLLRQHPQHPLAAASALRLWQLREEVPNWSDDLEQLTRDLAGKPAEPGARTWLSFMRLHAAWANARRSPESQLLDGAPVGFPQRWRLLEPLDIFVALGWEPAHKHLEAFEALPDTLTLDDLPRSARTLLIDGPGANVTFRYTGVHALEAWMDLRQPTEATVQLLCPAAFELTIDGETIAARPPGDPQERLRFARRVTLQPGLHRIRLLIATPTGNEPFTLLITPTDGADLQASFTPTPPAGSTATADLLLHPEDQRLYGAFEPDITRGHPALLWLSALASTEAGTIPAGRRDLDQLQTLAAGFPALPLTRAELDSNDPSLPITTREERRFAALRDALRVDPDARTAQLKLAALLYGNNQGDEALALLKDLEDDLPAEFAVRWRRFQLFRERGWTPEAEDALRAAIDLNPADCRLITARWDAWERLQTWPRVEDLPADFFGCDVTFERLTRFRDVPRGDLDAAIQRSRTLVARNPGTTSHLLQLAQLLYAAGRDDEAEATWARAAELAADPTEIHLHHLDALVARGHGQRAQQLLDGLRTQRPGNYSLLRRSDDLNRRRILGDLDKDGLAVIRDFLADPRGQDASAVYVLDFAATRVFPDGGNLTVTHNVIRVLNKEGIDEYGELEVPGNALLLSARTIKPDLTIREVEPIFGKPNLSMPSLEPGDFIEFSYLQGNDGSLLRRGAYLGFRWFFNIFDAALLHSEYLIELPASFDVTLDTRNGAPAPITTRTPTTQTLRFVSKDGPRVASEPSAAPTGEHLPSIQIASRFTWADLYRTWRDQLILHTAPDQALRDALQTVRDGLGERRDDPEALARALYSFTLSTVKDDDSGPFAQPAAAILAARSGDRLVVLQTLYDLANIPAEIVLARPLTNDITDAAVPVAESFNAPLLRVQLPSGEVWLNPSTNHAPFGFVPPTLRDARALRLGDIDLSPDAAEEALFTTLPPLPADGELRTVEIDLRLNAAGDAQGEAVEVYRGSSAVLLRRILDQFTDRDKLRQQFAQTLAPSFASPEITALTFEDEADDAKPLTLRYTFTTAGLARRDGDALVIDRAQLPARLQSGLAALPERRLPLLLLDATEARYTVRYHLPDGFQIKNGLAPAAASSPFGTYDAKPLSDLPPNAFGWTRSVHIPMQRIQPAQYPDFRAFARAVDEADRVRLSAAPR